MPTVPIDGVRRGHRRAAVFALVLCGALASTSVGCGGGGGDGTSDEQILVDALRNFGRFTPVRLDTARLARAARAGRPIRLPFALEGGGSVARTVRLAPRNLRAADLNEIVLKDGDAGEGHTIPLPPPSTYQGRVHDGGVAVFTITDRAVEGSMLVSPEGWSFIEPLEPQLRFNGVDPDTRRRLLKRYNHVVYNVRDALDGTPLHDDLGTERGPVPSPPPPEPLVLSIVADGDAALWRAYPLDSVMPFWLKQEAILNSVDWLYNCVEPEANAGNAHADCGNEFDAGTNAFQARVRIDRLEVWTSGGPTSPLRAGVLQQSIGMTHQASPPCCGDPHSAGRSNLVHFFSGADLDAPGLAAGEFGVNYYGPLCSVTTSAGKCHHALSQIVPGRAFRATAFHQHQLVAHEIGHNNGAYEAFAGGDYVCWLFGQQCGQSIMASNPISGLNLFRHTEDDAARMGVLLADELDRAPGP